MTTGPKTFLADYIDKIRLDLQNVEKTDYELNLAVHNERVAAAEAALELDEGAAFVVSASSPFGQFEVPQAGEERRSVVCGVPWRNPPTQYMSDGLVVEGSSGLDAAASLGLLYSPKLKRVRVDLVVVVPEFDQYLVDQTGRPYKLQTVMNVQDNLTMRQEQRIVYDGYLAAVIAGGPGALADPTLRARYAVYEEVDKAMPASYARKSQKERDAWRAKGYKDWVVRPRVA